jgi:DNA-directed RNA polymerase subunit K/omega
MSQEHAEYLYKRYYNGYRLIVKDVHYARELAMNCALQSTEDKPTLDILHEMCGYMNIKLNKNDSKTT